ncbi:MFS transporter [Microbacterium sp. CnD16-F]|uniref:MFS transporter n=1 Tax=Microbacterium sp. CnD16-F TaxID=2954493 RepID=UPI002096A31F|nr:MFS transporter [Microbacterium sp. CnD16-F]MCO7202935.1 MFS transporter [Microbacterium sp. CnD16-F]
MATTHVRGLGPLYLAGFTTAFGAHGVAAALGTETDNIGLTFATLGLILAIYDIAEVILKPVFGALSDRVGVKPIIVGGLLVFALSSALGAFATTPILLAAARLGQGAAAAAFSPASSSAVARLVGPSLAGRYFGKYGSWKGLGYAAGPLIGAGLIMWAGLPALFLCLAVLALAAAVWTAITMTPLPIIPKQRATLLELVKQSTAPVFLSPVIFLATATATLGVAVGFLPLIGSQLGLDPLISMGAVTVLAVVSAIVQPRIGRLHDASPGRSATIINLGAFLLVVALVVVAAAPSLPTILTSAILVGLGVGAITPVGFARLASTTPSERMGRTMGSAELGREVGDAGGPILVGIVAGAATLPLALGVMAGAAALATAAGNVLSRRAK